ncbi:hypothetical protein ACFLQO_00265 [Candidatus Aenigmatarchaeota archaeon]
MKAEIAILLLMSILVVSGCVSVGNNMDEIPNLELDLPPTSNDSVVDDLHSPIKPIYHTIKKSGFYEGNYINLSWLLEDEGSGFTPSNEKVMCIRFLEYPSEFVPVEYETWARFHESGYLKYSIFTNKPGKYQFKVCGIGTVIDDEFVDEETYAGDGDIIEVIVPEKPKIYIGESSYELVGPYSSGRYYTIYFKWDLEFFNKSTENICALVGHNLVETRFIQSNVGGGYGYSNTWKCNVSTLIARSEAEADFDGPITVKVSLWKFPDNMIYDGTGHEIVAIIPKREPVE